MKGGHPEGQDFSETVNSIPHFSLKKYRRSKFSPVFQFFSIINQ